MGLSNAYGTGSLRPGVCTSTSRPGSPFEGQLIYETDTDLVQAWNGSGWKSLGNLKASTNGSVLQVVSTTKTDTFTTSSTTPTDVTGLSVTITPTSTSSRILVVCDFGASAGTTNYSAAFFRLAGGNSGNFIGDTAGSRPRVTGSLMFTNGPDIYYSVMHHTYVYLDSPATTSATTYKLQAWVQTNSATPVAYVNRSAGDGDANWGGRGASSITVMEISG